MIDIVKLSGMYDARIDRWAAGQVPGKREILGQLVLLRFMIRENMRLHNEAWDNLRFYERKKNTLKQMGVAVPFLDREIQKQMGFVKAFKSTLAIFGQSLFHGQEAGATRDDLLNLCNAHRLADWNKRKLDEDEHDNFSGLVFVYNLDYPDDGSEFIEETVDAPFTHAMKEFMLRIMLHTPEGREASHQAMMEVFPEAMENAMTVRENEFGEKCLYDSKGNLVDTLEGVTQDD